MIADTQKFEIIDAHTHPFLDYENGCIGPYGKPEDMAEFDKEMKKVGIDFYSGSPLVKHVITDFAEIKQLNEDALRIRDQFPAYIPAMQVHGDFPQESIEEMHRLYQNENIRYIGELVPYIMGTGEFNSPGMLEIFKAAGELGMTVNLHDGSRETVTPVLEQAPGLNVILAHPGEPWGPTGAKGRFQFVSEYANLYMDISGYGLFRWNMLRYAVDVCGAEKIIFGSDMPTCSAGMYLYGALSENMTDDEFRLILGGNFRRLLGLKK